jgi:hypothetical protein
MMFGPNAGHATTPMSHASAARNRAIFAKWWSCFMLSSLFPGLLKAGGLLLVGILFGLYFMKNGFRG